MSKEILYVADSIANEKNVDKAIIFTAIEEALEIVTNKKYNNEIISKVTINPKTGDFLTYKLREVVDNDIIPEEFDAHKQIILADAIKHSPDLKIGDFFKEEIESLDFGRISAQVAKQVIIQKVREAERLRIAENYQQRIGELFIGTVRRVTRDYLIVELSSQIEAVLYKADLIQRENYRVGDKIRAVLDSINREARGPQLKLSRTSPAMLIALFKLEVPEIAEDVINIMGAARDPGVRAKISVKTNDGRIDPIGACVGMRGSRVQAVSSELHGEKIDIAVWDGDPIQYVINVMSPAEIKSIIMNEDDHSMKLIIAEDQLALSIGKSGKNINLASKLTGWTLNIVTEQEEEQNAQDSSDNILDMFIEKLEVDEDIAQLLLNEGFTKLEELAYTSLEEVAEIEGFDEEIAEELQLRAKDVLLNEQIALEEEYDGVTPTEDLLNLPGMEKELAYKLAQKGILDQESLAEQSVDELQEIIPELDKNLAADLIMEARRPWFEEE